MQAVMAREPGGPDVLRIVDAPDPTPGHDDILIRVAAAGVNRADLLQRMGFYPPPPGAPEILGLEVAGTIEAVGDAVAQCRAGDRVMALLEGGGYADLACAASTQVMRVPDGIDLTAAAAIPEAFITAHDNLVTRGQLRSGETVLVHGGTGGVGSAAVQLAHALGARVVVTAGSASKLERSRALGAAHAINYNERDFVDAVREVTDGRGADVILDVMGASYLERNLAALADDGRLVIIGLQGGTGASLDLARLLRKRASIIATTLRARSRDQKAAIVEAFTQQVLPRIAAGEIAPVVDRVLPLAQAAEAHRALERGDVVGKIVLRVAS